MQRRVSWPALAGGMLTGGLNVLGAVDETLPAGMEVAETRNPRLVMLLTCAGTCRLHIEGRELEHRPDRLVVSAGGVRFSAVVGPRPWRSRYLVLDGPWAHRLGRGLRRRPGACWVADPVPRPLATRLITAIELALAQAPDWDLMMLAPLGELFAAVTEGGDTEDEIVARLVALIDGEPGVSWRLPQLARRLGHSVPALTHRVRAATGLPPAAWVRQRRCLLAQRLLAAGANVAETATALGFTEPAHFSRQFRAVVGQWPSVWSSGTGSGPLGGVASRVD